MSDSSAGFVGLQAMLDKLGRLADMPREVAPAVAEAIDEEITAQIARGVDPNGKPWPKTQDGDQALRGAGKAVNVASFGKRVIVALRGVEARHHLGRARGGVQRQIIPVAKIPARMAGKIRDTLTERFADIMGGA